MKRLFAVFFVISFLFCACGSKIEGTYANDHLQYTFKPNGKLRCLTFQGEFEIDYKVEGDTIYLVFPDKEVVEFTVMDDGSIDTPSGRLKKITSGIQSGVFNSDNPEVQKKILEERASREAFLDERAKRVLECLAKAEEDYFLANKTYVKDPNALSIEWFSGHDDVRWQILDADKDGWRAIAQHKDSNNTFTYDSAQGGWQ